ncbi:DUF1232 domain-containing protein [Halobacillus sp. ACCC02827]|uniref:YkvA family protein n=1 Tax=Bacillaceae TaxID=186817 RepID=UPI0002A4D476|nr:MULTISPECIES: DUF1232 domain-containing protein [Bacillaceae]ELK48712.1 hypothetical protein D479_01992 [Halobacillus sp. BAB-2008]QHT48568.1 DUF1232 domain-containing protein [Bacillus sp. SB49]WJE17620.1 DUF1232 domain-containing protein [Halobacillus sp. ACCC02827]
MIKMLRRIKFLLHIRKSIPFLIRFFRSAEVTPWKKWLSLLFLLGYVAFPWDLIPDFLLVIGFIDDLAVLTFVLQLMVRMAPDSLKEEYEV